MKCPVVQRYLLGLEDPDHPCQAVRDHLSRCPACLACQQKLLQVEKAVALLPVPPSTAKSAFVQQFLQGAIVSRPAASVSWLPWQVRERGRRKLALAASLAAALLLFAFGWWYFQRGASTDHVAKEPLDLNAELRQTDSPQDRIRVCKNHAIDLLDKAASASGKDLTASIKSYHEVFENYLITEANRLSAAEREQLLSPVVAELEVAAKREEYEAKNRTVAEAEQLRELATAARADADRLRKLYS